jgi:hypothetical protein
MHTEVKDIKITLCNNTMEEVKYLKCVVYF